MKKKITEPTAAAIPTELINKIVTIDEVFSSVREGIDLAQYQRLLTAVDPEYLNLETRSSDAYKTLHAMVGEQNEKVLRGYDNDGVDLTAAREKANFLLGYAAALRLVEMAQPPIRP